MTSPTCNADKPGALRELVDAANDVLENVDLTGSPCAPRFALAVVEAERELSRAGGERATHPCPVCEQPCDCRFPGAEGEDCECKNYHELEERAESAEEALAEEKVLRDEAEKEAKEARRQLAAIEAARAKAMGKPVAGFARDEEWLREANCEIVGQDVDATVEAIGYALKELDRRATVIASQSAELASLRAELETSRTISREMIAAADGQGVTR